MARFGTDGQRQQWLPGVVAGDTVLTTALVRGGEVVAGTGNATLAVQRRADFFADRSKVRPGNPNAWTFRIPAN